MAQRPDAPRKEASSTLEGRMDGFNSFRAAVCTIRIRRAVPFKRDRGAHRVQFTYQDARARKMLQEIRIRFFNKKWIKP